ncbi:MAG: nucleotidyltransferase domain-containing protein [Desulfohalobiaceae bacterium]|nr:nucleotidyltransferase domain-containing protein [Desulfohalobiaceae bacterium]
MKTPTNNNSLVESIKLRINTWISGSCDAKGSILSIYIYGSVLHPDKFQRNSDIDLAFLLDQSLYKQDPLLCSGPAYMAATDIGLKFDRQTDVIILNSASIESAYQIVTTGIVIYEADHENRLEYETAVRGLYFDFKPFLQKLRNQRCRLTI